MGKPKKGQIAWNRAKVDKLALELKEWMIKNENEWMIEKFSVEKLIPYRYFTDVFPHTSNLFKETMDLCLDMKKVRFWQQVKDKEIPQTFAIFGSKNELEYRDRASSDDKKSNKKEQPTKAGVKEAIAKAKEKYFSKPD